MGKILAFVRALLLALWIIICVLVIIFRSLLFGENLSYALKVRKFCLYHARFILGLKVELKNKPRTGQFTYISNHRSYMDPLISLGDIVALPVAKAEVESWPLVGYAARLTGVMYVKREDRNSRKATLEAMEKTMGENNSVLIYPEGTTHDDLTSNNFKIGAFRQAVENGYAVLPIAIEYKDRADAWTGGISFVSHFLQSYGKWQTKVKVSYGEPIEGSDKKLLMEATKEWIDGQLIEMRRAFDQS